LGLPVHGGEKCQGGGSNDRGKRGKRAKDIEKEEVGSSPMLISIKPPNQGGGEKRESLEKGSPVGQESFPHKGTLREKERLRRRDEGEGAVKTRTEFFYPP